ncbi:hypothetical protein [uncultured Oscillibacter sp.]|uniref:hypothetical protein n=1 Tax=uncultured Oscillibacter sp. TaxID=876091 RepID=UPI0025FFC539|nr:hypothetical protein [uncultured Oscillibacter sp.]
MQNDFFRTVDEFRETQPARKLISNALKELIPARNNWVGFVISLILGTFIAARIGFANSTVELLSKTCETLIDVQLAIFGCVFAVYSILLAFLSDGYMKRLAKIPVSKKTSMLKQSLTYYESVLFLYFINIGLSGILILLTDCLPTDVRLTSNLLFDNSLASIILMLYFVFSFRVFYEVKSTIYNTVVLFRASIAYRFLDFSVEDNDDDTNDTQGDVK